MTSLASTKRAITACCITGILVSAYALFVEMKVEEDDSYEAMCDISEQMSCSHVLSSRWGRGFGVVETLLGEDSILNIPNSIFGIIFYATAAILNKFDSSYASKALIIMSITSNIMSVYLASILYFVLQDLCIVCVTTYTVNAVLLFLAVRKSKGMSASSKNKKQT